MAAAQQSIEENCLLGEPILLPLLQSMYYYAATDIYAPIDMPGFDNSAMDGYCFSFEDYQQGVPLRVTQSIQAGDAAAEPLAKGEAARIYTGARLPPGADTVVMQEKTRIENNLLQIMQDDIYAQANVRHKASQTKKGSLILSRYSLITSGVIGFLAGFGLREISIFQAPRIGILVSGKELVKAGTELQEGQIYESNSLSLQALLLDLKLSASVVEQVADDAALTKNKIREMLIALDVLIITGGISVGDYDFVHDALLENNVEKVFYKVQQKPGKPLFFGKIGAKRIFALPGNPASTATCFHQYVKPLLQAYLGKQAIFACREKAILQHDYSKKQGLTHFLKAHSSEGKVTILHGQESYKMDAFSTANCLVELDRERDEFKAGDTLNIVFI